MATGDFNSDGKLDLVVSEGNGGGGITVGVLLGNGTAPSGPLLTMKSALIRPMLLPLILTEITSWILLW